MITPEDTIENHPTFSLASTKEVAMPTLLSGAEATQSPISENQHLRSLVVSLSATLLRNVAREAMSGPSRFRSAEAGSAVHDAENCVQCAKLFRRKAQIAAGL